MDLLEFLRAREVTHVAEIAEALAVSTRTVLRDLATLRDRGHPIHAESGPGGGIRLERDRGVAAVHLSLDELASLWLSVQLAASVSAVPWSGAARSALDKALISLPSQRRSVLRRLLRRVVVGRPASSRVVAELGKPSAELLRCFELAFSRSVCLRFDYVDRHGHKSERVVEPHGLLVEVPAWYLLTRDTATGEARMFRMDRVRRSAVLERSFEPDFEGLRRQAQQQRTTSRAAGG
jgi:predicted DNA-binding transcriptional regulator YafY